MPGFPPNVDTPWTSDELAALVRAAQHEAGVRIAQAITAEADDTATWPEIAHLRALHRAAQIAQEYADRIVL